MSVTRPQGISNKKIPKLKTACKTKNCETVMPQRVRTKMAAGAKKTRLLKKTEANKTASARFLTLIYGTSLLPICFY